MTRFVNCVKLGINAEGLDEPPFPGTKGIEIFENISKQAWQDWLTRQTMLINEYRLASFELKSRIFLEEERRKFLFEGESQIPEGYVPAQSD